MLLSHMLIDFPTGYWYLQILLIHIREIGNSRNVINVNIRRELLVNFVRLKNKKIKESRMFVYFSISERFQAVFFISLSLLRINYNKFNGKFGL